MMYFVIHKSHFKTPLLTFLQWFTLTKKKKKENRKKMQFTFENL